MLKSLLCRSRKTTLPRQEQNPVIPDHLLSPDREDDGFTLVGETAIERSTVYCHSSASYLPPVEANLDNPPSYEECVRGRQRMQNLVYQNREMGQQQSANQVPQEDCGTSESQRTANEQLAGNIQSQLTIHESSESQSLLSLSLASSQTSMCSQPQSLLLGSQDTGQITTMSDVPFKLSPMAEAVFQAQTSSSSISCFFIPPVDWDQFDYSFTLEKNVLFSDDSFNP